MMNKYTQLARAISIAAKAHDGQYDKGGNPYILHPLHLMNQLMFDIQLATIAVLHDTIEDSHLELDDLKEIGFSYRVLQALDLLTHDKKDPYTLYIEQISGNYDTLRVKRKDIQHNLDVTRLKNKYELTEEDIDRIKKYNLAFITLTKAKRNFERK